MNVYTRTPNLLKNTAFTAFGDEEVVISPRKPQERRLDLQEKYSDLGDSFLPTSNEKGTEHKMDYCEPSGNQPPKRLKIPSKFLEEKTGRENAGTAIIKKQNKEAGNKSFKLGNESSSNGFDGGYKQNSIRGETAKDSGIKRKEINENMINKNDSNDGDDINRPASKLIQDNQNLQQLFDCVRGKEPEAQEEKSVGRLSMPTTFVAPASNGNPTEGSNWKRQKKSDAGYQGHMGDVMAIPFAEWKQSKHENGDREETVSFRRDKVCAGDEERRAEVVKAQYDMTGQGLMREDGQQRQTENDAKNYWLKKENISKQMAGKTGVKENRQNGVRLTNEKVYSATSCSTEFKQKQSYKSPIQASDYSDIVLNGIAGEGKTNGETSMNQKRDDNVGEIKSDAVQTNNENGGQSVGGNKRVGKLKMPNAFTSPQGNEAPLRKVPAGNRVQTVENGDESQRGNAKKVSNTSGRPVSETVSGRNGQGYLADEDDVISKLTGNVTDKTRPNEESGVKENGSSRAEEEKKPVGKLNLKAFFEPEKAKVDEKKEDSLVAKNKAVFDKKKVEKKSVGKLRLGSSKSERYEEIDNLSPERQLPSSMTNQMKDKLERILQGRSGSVSSQTSSSSTSSKKNETKEIGRLSSSSISSLSTLFSTPRDEDTGNKSEDDVFEGNNENGEENGKVNSGSLEFQLGNIFQNRLASSNSTTSSMSGSLNASFNAGGSETDTSRNEAEFERTEDEAQQEQESRSDYSRKEDAEMDKTERRKMITDAIKTRYEEKSEEENTSIEVESSLPISTFEEETESNDQPVSEKRDNEQAEDPARFKTEATKIKEETETEQMGAPKRGKIAIPSVFGNTGNESFKKRQEPITKSAIKSKGPKEEAGKTPNNKINNTIKECDKEQNENMSPIQTKGQNTASSFQANGNTKQNSNGKHTDANNTNKVSFERKGVNEINLPKKVNFQQQVGIIGEGREVKNTNIKGTGTGKLSSSLMQSFQRTDEDNTKPFMKRPPTPGRPTQSGRWNEKKDQAPIFEEDAEPKKAVGTQNILRLDDVEEDQNSKQIDNNENVMSWIGSSAEDFTAKSQEKQISDTGKKRTVGKLSIPSAFK
ncbi:enolase-phosphatase E1-like [Rhopilema esculentum]|uniref:enolase-phosphatase E1-like n=1 Tax=Rhopilema esculentum TaxID=499914 RepID=UPI0031CFBACD|eukprot:gene4399-20624_t